MDNIDIEKLKLHISELEEKQTPLTKSKTPKVKEILKPEVKEEVKEEVQEIKEKKRWSEKKEEQFKLMQEKRKAQVENNKHQKKLEHAKLLLEEHVKSKPKSILPKKDEEVKI